MSYPWAALYEVVFWAGSRPVATLYLHRSNDVWRMRATDDRRSEIIEVHGQPEINGSEIVARFPVAVQGADRWRARVDAFPLVPESADGGITLSETEDSCPDPAGTFVLLAASDASALERVRPPTRSTEDSVAFRGPAPGR